MLSGVDDWFISSYNQSMVTTHEICLLEAKLWWAFRKEANMMKLTISEIHLDLIQDYIFI